MRKFKVTYTIESSNIKGERQLSYETIEKLKADTTKMVTEMAEMYGVVGEFSLTMVIERNGEYYDSDETTAIYENGILKF